MTAHTRSTRLAAWMILLTLGATFAPLAPTTAAQGGPTAPALETLLNPSVEGAANEKNGFTLELGASTASFIALDGTQSVNVATSGAAPQSNGVLGVLNVFTTHPVLVSQVREVGYHVNVPTSLSRSAQVVLGLPLDVDADGVVDRCLVKAGGPLSATSGWERVAYADTTSFTLTATPDCASGAGAFTSIAALRADPAFEDAVLVRARLQSIVSGTAAWPSGAGIHLDVAGVTATSSPLLRIKERALNLCAGASFAALDAALACAADDATILVGPGTIPGGVTVAKRVTLCGSATMATSCGSPADDAIIRGGGAHVLMITADGVTLRDLTLDNPTYTATGNVDPALVVIDADRVVIDDARLRNPASALAGTQHRRVTEGVRLMPGAEDVAIRSSTFSLFPSSSGFRATCAAQPCVTTAINASAAGTRGLLVNNTTIDLAGAHPSRGIMSGGDDVRVEDSLIRVSAQDDADVSYGLLGVDGARAGWLVRRTTVAVAGGEETGFSRGIAGAFSGATFRDNVVRDHARGFDLAHATGAGNTLLEGNTLSANARGVQNAAPDTTVRRNTFVSNTEGVVAQGNGGLTGSSAGLVVTNNTLSGGTRHVRLLADVAGLYVNARENDWGTYTRASIRGLIRDDGANNVIDETCYVASNRVSRICPPVAAFSWSPSEPSWGKPIQFFNQSASGGRAIVSHSWTFGDGNTSSMRDPTHAYASPGARDVTLTVTDADGYVARLTKSVGVINRAPTLNPLANATIGEGSLLSIRLFGSDADGDALTYSVINAPPGSTFDAATRWFNWTPGYEQEGVYPGVTFRVSDGFASSTQSIVVTVTHANGPPVISIIGSLTGAEASTMEWTATAVDPDGDAISFFGFVVPQGASLKDHGNGTATFRWTPSYLQSGTYPFTVQASDGSKTSRLLVNLTVINTNRVPVWQQTPPQTIEEGALLQFIVFASDADGQTLKYYALNRPGQTTWNETARRFTFQPTYTMAGVYNLRFSVTDGETFVDMIVPITVTNTNRDPTMDALPDRSVLANRTLVVRMTARDADFDNVRFEVSDPPPGLVVVQDEIRWRPPPALIGTHTLVANVIDVHGGVGSTTLNVTVHPNEAPVVVAQAPPHVDVHAPATFSGWQSYDPDGAGGGLTYAWDWDELDGIGTDATGANATATFGRVGLHNVTLRVTDADGMTSTTTLQVDVDDAVQVFVTVDETYHATGGNYAAARLTTWDGAPIAGERLEYVVTYDAPGEPELRRGTLVTRPDGWAVFVINPDGLFVNLPGTHRVTVTAAVAGTYQGNVEHASGSATYADVML